MSKTPKPFSSEWTNAPEPNPEPRARMRRDRNGMLIRAFSRFPSERPLALLVVLILILGSFWFGGPQGEAQRSNEVDLVADVPETPQIQFSSPRPTVEADISTDSLQVTGLDEAEPEAGSALPELQLEESEEEETPTTAGGIFPDRRVLSFYGFPGNPEMGILGEYEMDLLLEELQAQAEEYEAADPDHPVILAFEVIASVAQKQPQADGSYLLDTPTDVLNQYADFTRENGMLLILDAQIGFRSVENDVKGLRPWLQQDHVHLAIDPEFAMSDGQIPGDQIGSIDAEDVTWAQQWLVELSRDEGISPKMLIVHQFIETMITNKHLIEPMPGVQLVIDADGWGPPDLKRSTYNFVNKMTEIEYAGIKLFYQLDVPLMSAEDIVNLDPPPLFVMYQ